MSYGKAIFGDNQFLGVNHADQAKASELFSRFARTDAIIDVLGAAYDAGIRDFMFTTHERYFPVFDEVRRSNLFPGLQYTPCLPYAHKYWAAMSERGMIHAVWSTIRDVNATRIAAAGASVLVGRFSGMIRLLTEIELHMCKGLPVRGVFMQNVLFDLLMATESYFLIEAYHRVVCERLGALPGFITMNHQAAVRVLCDDIGIEQPWLCANFNAAGFRMNPSRVAVEQSFASQRTRNIAMSIFSSGAGTPEESLNHVMGAAGVDAILFGSSSKANIIKNAQAIMA
jgi:hypothetical protein